MNRPTSSVSPQRFPAPRRSVALLGAALLTTAAAVVIVPPSPALAVDCPTVHGVRTVTGDWDGDGVDTVGIVDAENRWALRNSNTAGAPDVCFRYGPIGIYSFPVVGDWDGNGTDTVGVALVGTAAFSPEPPVFHLRNSNTAGPANVIFQFGSAGSIPVAGDWDGDGDTNIGVVERTATHLRWNLRRWNSAGPSTATFNYGLVGAGPVVGDWDGNGTDTVGVTAGSWSDAPLPWSLRNSNTGGGADLEFQYGTQKEQPVVGDWDGNGTDTPGVTVWTDAADNTGDEDIHWYLRNSASTGGTHHHFVYGVDRPAPPR